MATNNEEARTGCLVMIVLLLLTPLSAWWSGFVMLKLYNWFILPVTGAPHLEIGNMLGISLLMSMMLSGLAKSSKTDKNTWADVFGEAFARMAVVPFVFLVFGYLYQMLFMR